MTTENTPTELILPLDHPFPYASVYGVMHYPGTDLIDRGDAKSFASQHTRDWLPFVQWIGSSLSREGLDRIIEESGPPPENSGARWSQGTLMGQMFRVFLTLAHKEPALATWSNIALLMQIHGAKHDASLSKSKLCALRVQFAPVAHLWAA